MKKIKFDLTDWEKDRRPKENDKKGYLGQKDQTFEPLPYEKCLFYICGKDEDHVLSCNLNKKPYTDYVACKAFVEKPPRERDKILFQKRMCSKCLKPGVRWNTEHACNKQYICNKNYIHKGKDCKCEKHVLVCGYHSKERSNQGILEKYKRNVIKAHGNFSSLQMVSQYHASLRILGLKVLCLHSKKLT